MICSCVSYFPANIRKLCIMSGARLANVVAGFWMCQECFHLLSLLRAEPEVAPKNPRWAPPKGQKAVKAFSVYDKIVLQNWSLLVLSNDFLGRVILSHSHL